MAEKIYKRKTITPDRQSDMEALIASNLIGLRFPGIPGESPLQNFAMVTPFNPIESKIFIHGRELFSPEAAAQYFAPHADKDRFPYAAFGEAAKEKIWRALSPESFEDRLMDYMTPHDAFEHKKYCVRELRERFADYILPALPELTPENVHDVQLQLFKTLEEQDADLCDLDQKAYFPTPDDIAKIKQQISSQCLERIDTAERALIPKHADAVRHFEASLIDYLKSHDGDPEIINNFAAGIRSTTNSIACSLEEILRHGIEARTETLLRQYAKALTDPYSSVFTIEEKRLAENLVHSVHPRTLLHARRRKTAILATDTKDLDIYADILHAPYEGAAGIYVSKAPISADFKNDFMIITIPLAIGAYAETGRIGRHELAHFEEFQRKIPYVVQCREEIPRLLAEAEHNLQDTIGFLLRFPLHPNQEEWARLARLEQKRDSRFHWNEALEKNDRMRCRQLLNDVKYVLGRMSPCFPDSESKLYPLQCQKLDEIPARIIELQGKLGASFIRELMPGLYKSVVRYKIQDENMRRDSDRAR